jgi:hypothetical protein
VREFRDDQGRPWQVALTVAAAMRVKDSVTVEVDGEKKPFDLVDVASISQTMQVLRGQYTTIAETLYAILQKQVADKKLTKEDFLDGLRGDALDAAAKVLEQELVDFFPLRLRRMVGLLAAKMDEATTELLTRAEAAMAAATTSDLLAQSGMPSGQPQGSSASTQESGPSDNSPQPAMAA